MKILKVSPEIRWEKMSNRINRVIGSIPLNGKRLSGSAPKLSGSPVAHLINSSALPDKLFHPRHQPIILYNLSHWQDIFWTFQVTADEVCGCPIVSEVFEEKGEICLTAKRKCNKHYGWEKCRRAQIDMERVRQVSRSSDKICLKIC